MVSFVSCMLAGVSIVPFLAPNVNAHQVVLLPKPDWKTKDKDTQYNPLAFLENQDFKTEEDFAKYRDANGYKSLRDFFDRAKYTVTEGADAKCGFTDPNGPPQPIPDKGEMRSTGYTHDGPCEVWLDDTKVLGADNCHEKYPGKDYTVDYSSCKDSCTLYWYWLGVRNLKNKWSWQVYKACIPLSAGSTSDGSTPDGNTPAGNTTAGNTPAGNTTAGNTTAENTN